MLLPFKTFFCFLLFLALFSGGVFTPEALQAGDVSQEAAQARSAGVPEASLSRVLALGVDHSVPSAHMAAYLQILQAAAEESIPVTPFVDKIEEGLGKRIAPHRITKALTFKLDDYRLAQEVVATVIRPRPGTFEPADLTPLGESLDLGITANELITFLEQAPDAPLSMLLIAVENLALLKQIDFDMTMARELLFAALDHQVLDGTWQTLPKAVAAARSRNLSDAAIALAISQVVEKGGGSEQIWQALELE